MYELRNFFVPEYLMKFTSFDCFCFTVYPSHQIAYVYITIEDVNDNYPVFTYPVYPTNLQNEGIYIGVVSLFAQTVSSPVMLMVSTHYYHYET